MAACWAKHQFNCKWSLRRITSERHLFPIRYKWLKPEERDIVWVFACTLLLGIGEPTWLWVVRSIGICWSINIRIVRIVAEVDRCIGHTIVEVIVRAVHHLGVAHVLTVAAVWLGVTARCRIGVVGRVGLVCIGMNFSAVVVLIVDCEQCGGHGAASILFGWRKWLGKIRFGGQNMIVKIQGEAGTVEVAFLSARTVDWSSRAKHSSRYRGNRWRWGRCNRVTINLTHMSELGTVGIFDFSKKVLLEVLQIPRGPRSLSKITDPRKSLLRLSW